MGAAILTESLTRGYRGRRGIEEIDLSVPEGSLFGFLGANGAGKTTTIRVLLGFLRPGSGSARIFGMDCWREGRAVRAEVGYLPGDLRLYPWMDARSALRFSGRVRGKDVLSAGLSLARELDLDSRVPVRKMSRGMRQKLGLVLAFAHDPSLLVLDEPTTALDPLIRKKIHDLLRERAAAGRTVFFSTHSLAEVDQLCDRVAIVRDGSIAASATLRELREQAGYEVRIRFADEGKAARRESPPFLQGLQRNGAIWTGALHGPFPPFLQWIANEDVVDLSVGRPDLETLFQRYYGDESA